MRIDRDTLRDFARSSKLEWLETNGTGAFAMGTVAGVNTRRYHALLAAPVDRSLRRYVLLSRLEEEVNGAALGACQYPGVVAGQGYLLLEHFDSFPCASWTWRIGDATIEKQVYLIGRRQAVVARYRASRALAIRVRPFLAYRDYHSLGRKREDVFGALPPLTFDHQGRFEPSADWYYNVEYLDELDRGLDFREDLYTPGVIVLDVKPEEWSPVVASIEPASYSEPSHRAEPFTVTRAGRPTILAGYPWFTDWGRDAMISLPGLLIAAGRLDEARAILEGFLAHRDRGLIPNRFPDAGETPQYNSADATLWMFQAVRAYLDAGGDRSFLRDVFYPAAKEILDWHRRGTWFGIGADPADHLLRCGAQLTWMDTRYTPRAGKPVEINALWHGALSLMARWAGELGDARARAFREEAETIRDSFRAKFWNPERACLYDCAGDPRLRPNQIFAVSLPFGLLERRQQQAAVRAVHRELLTPLGLRTLEPGDPDYKARYAGGPDERDAAYHQGTVWPWLMGPFVDAYLTACGASEKNLAYCRGLAGTLEAQAARQGCPDSIAEIYDAEPPHRARGCPAQAWSVAEIARVKAAYFSGSK
ncbi:MAG TPA: amylo-alpha-1,6-glucosidase [Bryobacteraceae bacterium]|nr:amylo-alpha-1,6-glucosidase [Bryobacteraceae bacterium]